MHWCYSIIIKRNTFWNYVFCCLRQNCILAVRTNWSWMSKLIKCADLHLQHVSEYHQVKYRSPFHINPRCLFRSLIHVGHCSQIQLAPAICLQTPMSLIVVCNFACFSHTSSFILISASVIVCSSARRISASFPVFCM